MRIFFVKLAAVIIAAGLVLAGCPGQNDPDDVPVTGVSLSTTALTMGLSATATLTAIISPGDATDKGLSWSSNAENVATVNEGTVTSKVAGTAVITVTTNDGGFTATCTVTVDASLEAGTAAVSGVQLNETTKTLDVGGTFTLTATIVPEEARKDKTVTWSSSDAKVATVSNTGEVKAIAFGSARITATVEGKSATCTVTVNDPKATVQNLLDTGISNLKGGYFDGALTSFEAAFAKDEKGSVTYTESVVYSSLAKLASLVKDQSFRNLLSNHTGVTNYPESIDELLSGKWMEDYTDEELVWYYYDDAGQWVYWRDAEDTWFFTEYKLTPQSGYYYYVYSEEPNTSSCKLSSTEPKYETAAQLLPGLPVPAWFQTTNAYKDSLSVNGLKTPGTWELLLMANLLDKNSSGLNALLDGVLSSVFGPAFEDAVARANLIDYTTSFKVDEDTLGLLGVRDIFEGDVNIGKAELDLLFSAMRGVKASLQWVSAYDWDTDLSFLKTEWNGLDGRIDQLSPANLPFRNNFLKDRGNSRMADSKASYSTAIDTAIAAYNSMIAANSHLPPGAVDTLKEFGWIKDGLSKLKTAINDGGTFYVQEGSGSTYSNTQSGALFGVNLGKFFTPGQFAIDKLITTDGSGNTVAPKFFGMKDEDTGAAITAKDQIKGYSMIGFELKFASLKEVLVLGFDFSADNSVIPLLPPDIAEQIYGLYH
ncbi:MAG: Ig-like domain-containing protein [Treponema sp.]|jgi:hypothetical protein|nr:Ig-like domain-containing protein [Treponema sp.]